MKWADTFWDMFSLFKPLAAHGTRSWRPDKYNVAFITLQQENGFILDVYAE